MPGVEALGFFNCDTRHLSRFEILISATHPLTVFNSAAPSVLARNDRIDQRPGVTAIG
ncbi:MAG: glycogen debranching N-terminal domain-containing protein [Candidatus Korobacteraceae bacterium]